MIKYSKNNPGQGFHRVSPGVYDNDPQAAIAPQQVNKIIPEGMRFPGRPPLQQDIPSPPATSLSANTKQMPMPGRLASWLPNGGLGRAIPDPWGAMLYGGGFQGNPYAQVLLNESGNDSWGMPWPTQKTRPQVVDQVMQSMAGGIKK